MPEDLDLRESILPVRDMSNWIISIPKVAFNHNGSKEVRIVCCVALYCIFAWDSFILCVVSAFVAFCRLMCCVVFCFVMCSVLCVFYSCFSFMLLCVCLVWVVLTSVSLAIDEGNDDDNMQRNNKPVIFTLRQRRAFITAPNLDSFNVSICSSCRWTLSCSWKSERILCLSCCQFPNSWLLQKKSSKAQTSFNRAKHHQQDLTDLNSWNRSFVQWVRYSHYSSRWSKSLVNMVLSYTFS